MAYKRDSSYCFTHNAIEPVTDSSYKRCRECGHVYQTKAELRKAYKYGYWQTRPYVRPLLQGWYLRGLVYTWLMPVSRMAFCPECIHDF